MIGDGLARGQHGPQINSMYTVFGWAVALDTPKQWWIFFGAPCGCRGHNYYGPLPEPPEPVRIDMTFVQPADPT